MLGIKLRVVDAPQDPLKGEAGGRRQVLQLSIPHFTNTAANLCRAFSWIGIGFPPVSLVYWFTLPADKCVASWGAN